MKLWLDDVRDPRYFGAIGWTWVKTPAEAIEALQSGTVEAVSLDHDLDVYATIGMRTVELTGFTVVEWMEEAGYYPAGGVLVHSMNASQAPRMVLALERLRQRVAPEAQRPSWRIAGRTDA